jgi:aconitate hydratase
LLRKYGVVGKFVEFFGDGLRNLTIADRATISNMSPEYGCTCSIFPPDEITLQYLEFTGRGSHELALVKEYLTQQDLMSQPDPIFNDVIELDLDTIRPCVSGPKRPQDRIELNEVPLAFGNALPSLKAAKAASAGNGAGPSEQIASLKDGAVVIAAITSCTNTSNPSVMLAAGLLARKAVQLGLSRKPWVKTSLAPGSKTVTEYYRKSGLDRFLDKLGFNLVGYGCTTCIGNSGPLPTDLSDYIQSEGIVSVVGKSQLRRAHTPGGESKLFDVATACGGLCNRGLSQMESR